MQRWIKRGTVERGGADMRGIMRRLVGKGGGGVAVREFEEVRGELNKLVCNVTFL